MSGDDYRRHRRRLVVWLVVTLCVFAELVGLGLVRASGATGLSAPVISSVGLPADPTTVRSATFFFTNEQTVEFRCTLDGGAPDSCGAGLLGSESYPGPLSVGRHVFEVRALVGTDASDPATYAWTVGPSPVEPTPQPDDGGAEANGDGDGSEGTSGGTSDGSGAAEDGVDFEISGAVDGLAPGITKPIPLQLHNPNAAAIRVTSITVEIAADSSPPGCESDSNIALRQAAITEDDPVVVPGGGSVVLSPGRAPTITFRNRPWNQDVCKGKSFELTYTGSAHS